MPEKPIKLFATRVERYPEREDGDIPAILARAGLSGIPGVGSPIAELISLVLTPSLERRRDQWFRELANDLDRLEATVEGFKRGNLAKNDAYVTAVIEATRIAVAGHFEEKRVMLRNALLKIALDRAPSDEVQHIFLSAIEAFTPSHVTVLGALRNATNDLINKHGYKTYAIQQIGNYGHVTQKLVPNLKGQDDLLACIFTDLRNRGFSVLSDPAHPFPHSKDITKMDVEFLDFVLAPVKTSTGVSKTQSTR
jgi:hypothetical protein